MMTALASNDPTMVFESQRLYDRVEILEEGGAPKASTGSTSQAVVRRSGGDVTILTIGPSLYPALDAADALSSQASRPKSSMPAPSCRSTTRRLSIRKKTGWLIIVSEAVERGSFANTVATNVAPCLCWR